jgi:hypothetical protein
MAACLLVTMACHNEAPPTAPSPPVLVQPDPSTMPLELSDQRYLLQISGGDLTGDPTYAPCSPILVPRAGKWVTTFLWFAWEDDELVGRSRAPYRSTLILRLRRISSSVLGVAVTGRVTGSAEDEYDYIQGKRDTTFTADADVMLNGTVAPHATGFLDGARLGGQFSGATSFSDSTGAVSRCTNVQYYMEVRRPGGPDDDPTTPPISPGLGARAVGASARPDGAGAPTRLGRPAEAGARTP